MGSELRESGISVVGRVPWGTHFCHFYETREDLLAILIPYFRAGLENNEFCMWVVFDPLTPEEASAALIKAFPETQRSLASGQISIAAHSGGYLKTGTFLADSAIDAWKEKLARALAAGYDGMRINGNEPPLTREKWTVLSNYEHGLHDVLDDELVLVMCTYPLVGTQAAELFDAARSHEFAIAMRHGKWDILCSPELRHAQHELNHLHRTLDLQVTERTTALTQSNADLRSEIAERKQIEDELRRQKELLQTIFDNSPVMINFVGPDGAIRLVNPEWERVLGWSLRELLDNGIDIFDETYPDATERERVFRFMAFSNGKWEDFKTRTRDGRVIDTTWATIHLSDGTSIGIGQDITQRKQGQEKTRVLTEQLRALSARLGAAREEESTRIAREIHDELGSALTSLRWDLEGLGRTLGAIPPSGLNAAAEKVRSMLALSDNLIGSVRRIASELRPSILDDLGLVEAIESQVLQFQTRTGIPCEFACFAETFPLTSEQSTAVFRISQEAMTNVARHAHATKVDVVIREDAGALVLTISDDGRGITIDEQFIESSIGLLGMRERARLAGGEMDIFGIPGEGTTVIVRIPFRSANRRP